MKFQRLTTEAEVRALIRHHNERSDYVVLDLETTGLDPHEDRILHCVVSGHEPGDAALFDGLLVPALAQLEAKRLVLHNFKFDYHFLSRAGVDLRRAGPVHDTLLMHHLLDENLPHGLDDLVQAEFQDPYKAEFWSRNKTYATAPEAEQLEYACKDVIYTGMLYERFMDRLVEDGIPPSLVEHVHSLALALYATELGGIPLDIDYLSTKGVELKSKIDHMRIQMRSMVEQACLTVEHDLWAKQIEDTYTPRGKKWMTLPKPAFSFDSTKQLSKLLYEVLGLPAQRNKKKNYTVDDEALGKLKDKHPVVPVIQEYRGYNKVYGAFIQGTLERMKNGRIYPSFNVNGAVTGRISSSSPNLQQLPRDGGIRGIYVPDHGRVLISCDYAQLEVVIAAHYSHDANLLRILNEGLSMHDITADALSIPRQQAKTLNFSMQYQCSHYKVAEILGVNERHAQQIWNRYWQTYSGVKRVIDECAGKVDRGEPIVNIFGRKRRFPRQFSQKWEEASAKRQAFSSLIQGTGADCTHLAFYTVADELRERGWGRALFEVHDEILIEVDRSRTDEATELLTSTMVVVGQWAGLSLPLRVDCSEPLERWEK